MKNNDLNDVLSAVLERVDRMPEREPDHFKDEPGDNVAGEGIFLCTFEMKHAKRMFNVYAAPEDLTTREYHRAYLSYKNTLARIAELKKWHGHDGGSYKIFREVFDAVENKTYKGEWFIPSMSFLSGQAGGLYYNSLYRHRNAGSFNGTFNTSAANPRQYWSSTMEDVQDTKFLYPQQVDFSSGKKSVQYDRRQGGFCRPIRLVEVHGL
jgi:hypothetical protein